MKLRLLIPVIFLFILACNFEQQKDISSSTYMEGWNILSPNDTMANKDIEKASEYGITHLQLSHNIVMDLKDVKKPEVAERVNRLTKLAHEKGISEVTVWDHSLYSLSYYPDQFKTGPNGTINLDNPEFWRWIKTDIRKMLKLIPEVDGIILTFIETGAHVEDQYSEKLLTEEEKLAAMVDSLASVIIDEYDLSLYVRTFIYTKAELGSLLGALNLIKNNKVKVMTKEVPHDFFLTHPVSTFVKDIESPVLIEFDAAHEYNGQGIIASIFPELHVKRWQYYSKLPNVIGYVARTDRFNNTSIINTPSEINLFALHKAATDGEHFNMEEMYNEFISEKYGENTVQFLKPVFKMAPEIIESSLYTLKLPISSHSSLDIENKSAYQRHVSGKWLTNMEIEINHNIDTTLHYWKDIVNHLSPAWNKGTKSDQLSKESKWVLDSNWLEPEEKMDLNYLKLINEEKEYGVEKAKQALELIHQAKAHISSEANYNTLLHVFERTYLTARLYECVAKIYFGYRVLYQGNDDSAISKRIVEQGMNKMPVVIDEILAYPFPGPIGQYNWTEDAYRAMTIYNNLVILKSKAEKSYDQNSFEKITYRRFSEEQKQEILKEFMKRSYSPGNDILEEYPNRKTHN